MNKTFTLFYSYKKILKEEDMADKPIKPGTDNQPAGTYREVGPRGGNVSGGRVVHIDKGDRLPPTQKSGNGWIKK